MWMALLQDITFLLPSSPTKGTEEVLLPDPCATSHCCCSNSFRLVSDPRVST